MKTITAMQMKIWKAGVYVEEKRRRAPTMAEMADRAKCSIGSVSSSIDALVAAGICTREAGKHGSLRFVKKPVTGKQLTENEGVTL
jgi:DNA-binding MarR family transcriptional regulator